MLNSRVVNRKMYRKFIETLRQWEANNTKEPILVTGARQVGKTWLIKEFCSKEYDDHLYLNFESEPQLASIFESSLDPKEIIRRLGVFAGRPVSSQTALIFDEIQKCEKAVTSLKYFCEAEENYRVIGAGSLLGVKINRFESSFPVGKVKVVNLPPMDFEEFLLASGEGLLAEEIRNSYAKMQKLPELLHDKAIRLYHDYLYVGGMPRCINDYVQNGCDISYFDRELQGNIILAYTADMSKYTSGAAESVKIREIYDSVPRQLARENPKFKYKDIRGNANKRDFYLPLDWLVSSGIVIKVVKAELPQNPLKAYENESIFKVYMSDVGLLSFASGVNYKSFISTEDNIFKGAVTENYVIQSLAAQGRSLFYYKPDESMEIDILLEDGDSVIPVEIKSGRHKRSTSLKNYNNKFVPQKMIRISENNFGQADNLISIPLYAVFCI